MIREELLALADELEGVSFKENCDQCLACGTALCRGDMECAESVHKACAKRLRAIAEHEAEDVTTVSAYDLLPDVDREALASVREQGGVDKVREKTRDLCDALNRIADRLGVGIESRRELWPFVDVAFDAIDRRLMPEGCEWPRFEDGEPVKLRDVIVPPEGGEPREVVCINHFKDCWYIGLAGASSERLKRGERVKRPAVLAADGEPLEAGQTVYAPHYDYVRCTVLSFELAVDGWLVEVENEGGHKFRQTPDEFIHQRPEPPDSWERVEEDARLQPTEYTDRYRVGRFGFESEDMRADLVRRCRALAERGE